MNEKIDRITIRFPPAIGRKIRALAKARGVSLADYCRALCMLEIVHEEPHRPFTLNEYQLKDTMAEMQHFAELEPQHQLDVLRRSLEAITTVKKAADKAFTWIYAVASASDALSKQTGGPQDASPRHARRARPPLDG